MSTIRIRILFSYEGTNYHGWQRQKDTRETIQEIFENKLSQIANTRLNIVSSGRTDTGVHARIQVAHVDVPTEFAEKMLTRPAKHPNGMNRLELALNGNGMLPHKIRIWKVEKTAPKFHAQRDVRKKTYLYFIDTGPVQWPHLRNYAWHLRLPLDVKGMQSAALKLVGAHDFKAFCAADSSAKTTTRTLFESKVDFVDIGGFAPTRLLVCRFTGNGFLKQMVRSMVGTLAMIGNGRAKPELISELLQHGRRNEVGNTAPPHGLWLWDILY